MPSPSKLFWGKHFWFIIHYLSLKLPIDAFFVLLHLLTFLLPCYECRGHLSDNIETLKSRKHKFGDAFAVGYELHRMVNHQLHVHPANNPTLAQARNYYSSYGNALFDSELIFVLRVICLKYDHHRQELERFVTLVEPLVSPTLRKVMKTYPLTNDYETESDLFFWAYKIGEEHSKLRLGDEATYPEILKFFKAGMSDDCDACNLR